VTALASRSFARDPLGTIEPLLADGVAEARVGNRSLLLLATPEGAREALVLRSRDLVKQNVVTVGRPDLDVAQRGLMTSLDSERHLAGRRRYQPFFSSRRVGDFESLVRQEATALVDGWADRGRADLSADLARYATRVAFRAIFDHDPPADDTTSDDAHAVLDAFRLVIDWRAKLGVLHIVEGVRFARGLGRLEARLAGLLDTPLGAATDDERLDLEQRVVELRGILLAAVDTTSSALAWALDAMSRDPALADAAAADGTAVFAETLRLHPPAWYIGRMALRRVELAGHAVEPGGLVWILPYFIHRDGAAWPDPLRFDPARFSAGVEAQRGSFSYLPFGAGARQCLGEHLAWLAGRELLGEAGRRLRLRPTQPPVAPRADATLRPSRPIVCEATSR
jgi:cytochrome P450